MSDGLNIGDIVMSWEDPQLYIGDGHVLVNGDNGLYTTNKVLIPSSKLLQLLESVRPKFVSWCRDKSSVRRGDILFHDLKLVFVVKDIQTDGICEVQDAEGNTLLPSNHTVSVFMPREFVSILIRRMSKQGYVLSDVTYLGTSLLNGIALPKEG